MPNPYFNFKQFTVAQQNCAMKVTTDACILGALVPVTHAHSILDIGAGTGLLSLMTAQRSTAHITAIEINKAAYYQCSDNFSLSPWKERLFAVQADFKEWAKTATGKYDAIICNPPFFTSHLPNEDSSLRQARHTDTLSAIDVIDIASSLLSAEGFIVLLVPSFAEKELLNTAIRNSLPYIHIVSIADSHVHPVKRILFFASAVSLDTYHLPERIEIKNASGEYSAVFTELLAPYYLNL